MLEFVLGALVGILISTLFAILYYKINMTKIKALVADKDELAGRLMQYDTILKQARKALQDSIAYGLFKDDFNFRKTTCYETIKKVTNSIDTLLGGKENGKM